MWKEFLEREIPDETNYTLESKDEPYFRHSGCEICRDGGNNVYDCVLYFGFKEGKGFTESFNLEICGECICEFHYGKD